MSQNLRTFLDLAAALPGQVVQVERETEAAYGLSAVLRRLEADRRFPMAVFTNVAGTSLPVVTNVFADRTRLGLCLGTDYRHVAEEFGRRSQAPIPPVPVSSAPVKDVVRTGDDVDLSVLPQIIHSEGDAGPYLTAGIAIVRDEESGAYNAGIYRLQFAGPRQLRINPAPGSDLWRVQRAKEGRDEPLEVAIAIGHHPAVYLASQHASGADEVAIAGGLLGEPVRMVPAETLGIDVPADAEIVIEGRILPRRRETEGPFVELAQFLNRGEQNPIIEVTALTMRRDALLLDVFSAHADHNNVGLPAREARLLARARQVCPAVAALCLPTSAAARFAAFVAVDEPSPGLARNVALHLLGSDPVLKLVVLTNTDVDVFNESDVIWSLATRVQADADVIVLPGTFTTALDPARGLLPEPPDPLAWRGAKWIIDATAPPQSPAARRGDLPAERWRDVDLSAVVTEYAPRLGEPDAERQRDDPGPDQPGPGPAGLRA